MIYIKRLLHKRSKFHPSHVHKKYNEILHLTMKNIIFITLLSLFIFWWNRECIKNANEYISGQIPPQNQYRNRAIKGAEASQDQYKCRAGPRPHKPNPEIVIIRAKAPQDQHTYKPNLPFSKASTAEKRSSLWWDSLWLWIPHGPPSLVYSARERIRVPISGKQGRC